MRSMIAVTLTASSGAPCASSSAQPRPARAAHGVVAHHRIAARAGVLDQSVHFLRRHAAVLVEPAGIALDDAARDLVGQGGQERHAARSHAQRLALAGVGGEDLHGVAADLAVQADGIVSSHHLPRRRCGRQPSQHLAAAGARAGRGSGCRGPPRAGRGISFGARHGQHRGRRLAGRQQAVAGGALDARQAGDIGHAQAVRALVPAGPGRPIRAARGPAAAASLSCMQLSENFWGYHQLAKTGQGKTIVRCGLYLDVPTVYSREFPIQEFKSST